MSYHNYYQVLGTTDENGNFIKKSPKKSPKKSGKRRTITKLRREFVGCGYDETEKTVTARVTTYTKNGVFLYEEIELMGTSSDSQRGFVGCGYDATVKTVNARVTTYTKNGVFLNEEIKLIDRIN